MLSFIIPVYNGEKYIEDCVDSVLNLNFNEFEIIIINDGSKDNTLKICNKLSGNIGNIKVFSIENSGQGIARNYGIKKASGNYIAFIDADDTVVKKGFNVLYEKAIKEELDIVSGIYYRETSKGKEIVGKNFLCGIVARNGRKEEVELYNAIKTQSIFGYLWNKIYKTKFLIDNEIFFEDTKKMAMEDTMFNILAFSCNPKYYHINIPVYNYNAKNTSTTRKYDPEIVEKNLLLIKKIAKNLNERDRFKDNIDLIVPLVARTFCWTLMKNSDYENKAYSRNLDYIIKYNKNKVFKSIVTKENYKNELKKIPGKLEEYFYRTCLFCFKKEYLKLLAVGFTFLSPLFKVYIRKTLK